jgi:hypothetical protein
MNNDNIICSNREARERFGAEKFLDIYAERFFEALDRDDVVEAEKQMALYKDIVGANDLMYYLLEDIYNEYKERKEKENMDRYSEMSLRELRLLGDKELNRIANEIMAIFNSTAQVYDEDLGDYLNQLDDLYERIDYVLSIDTI